MRPQSDPLWCRLAIFGHHGLRNRERQLWGNHDFSGGLGPELESHFFWKWFTKQVFDMSCTYTQLTTPALIWFAVKLQIFLSSPSPTSAFSLTCEVRWTRPQTGKGESLSLLSGGDKDWWKVTCPNIDSLTCHLDLIIHFDFNMRRPLIM